MPCPLGKVGCKVLRGAPVYEFYWESPCIWLLLSHLVSWRRKKSFSSVEAEQKSFFDYVSVRWAALKERVF